MMRIINRKRGVQSRLGFTLVELLIVLLIFSILAAIALPTVKNLVSDQKVVNGARGLASFMEFARNRAISEGRPTGVLLERMDTVSTDPSNAQRATAVRFRILDGVAPYSGDASDSEAVLATTIAGGAINTAIFDARDNQLLKLSAVRLATSGAGAPPIQIGDLIEFPGGRTAPILQINWNPASTPETVSIQFDLTEQLAGSDTRAFPRSARTTAWVYPGSPFTGTIPANATRVRFKIHRRPVVSQTLMFNFPRGVALDFNYSGSGVNGNELAPATGGVTATNIPIIFGPDGKVISYSNSLGTLLQPTGLIFLCIGEADRVRSDNLVSEEKKSEANILNLDSTWIVVNPNTGRIVASPFAAAAGPGGMITNPNDPSLDSLLTQARSLALLSDTVDGQ